MSECALVCADKPNAVLQLVSRQLRQVFEEGKVKGIRALVAQHTVVERLLTNMVAIDSLVVVAAVVAEVWLQESLEAIRGTPEPFSYQKHLRLATQLWLLIMPLSLLPSLQIATLVLGPAIGSPRLLVDQQALNSSVLSQVRCIEAR